MPPRRIAATQTTRRRRASAQAHSGRRAASRSAQTVSASGTAKRAAVATAPAVAGQSMVRAYGPGGPLSPGRTRR